MPTGNGAILVPLVGLEATLDNTDTAFGDIQVPAMSVSGSGISPKIGNGDVAPLAPFISASGFAGHAGEGDIQAPFAFVTGVGQVEAIPAPAVTLSATGLAGQVGQGVVRTDADVVGTALTGFAGYGDITTPAPEISAGSGSYVDVQVPLVVLDGVLDTGLVGFASLYAPTPDVSATGFVEGTGIAVGSIQSVVPRVSATGTSLSRIDGVVTASDVVIEGSGFTGQVGSVSIVVPVITVDASALSDASGTGEVIVTVPIISATGVTELLSPVFTGIGVNTRTGAATEYTGLTINSMTRFSGMTLAATDDGLVALSGTTDDGSLIQANVSGGVSDFNSTSIKQVLTAYVTCRAEGNLSMSLITDEKIERVYTLLPRESGLHPAKVRFGRGERGRHWQWRIANNGNDFNVNQITIEVETSVRRKL